MILLSDLMGILSSLFLLFTPAKDQIYRFLEFRQTRKESPRSVQTLRNSFAAVWRERRDAYSGWDSLLLAIGAALLLASFVLKAFGL